jgi:hypothetical protein
MIQMIYGINTRFMEQAATDKLRRAEKESNMENLENGDTVCGKWNPYLCSCPQFADSVFAASRRRLPSILGINGTVIVVAAARIAATGTPSILV